jgi:hypothetical protein
MLQLDFPVKPKGQLQKENDSKFLQMLKEQRRDGKVTEHGLYEMLQEYMIENEMLRSVLEMTSEQCDVVLSACSARVFSLYICRSCT